MGVPRMSVIMIRCPDTGEDISTGIDTDSITFRRLPKVTARLLCPACGKEHVWATDCAWLDGQNVQPRRQVIEIRSA
jgi:hypothetical protein